jgi:hypothetical protein
MALRIANPALVKKIEALAHATGLSVSEAVEKAVDRLLAERTPGDPERVWKQFDGILARLDRVKDLPNGSDPLEWDEHGLPR